MNPSDPISQLLETWRSRRDSLWSFNRTPEGHAETERYQRTGELNLAINDLEAANKVEPTREWLIKRCAWYSREFDVMKRQCGA